MSERGESPEPEEELSPAEQLAQSGGIGGHVDDDASITFAGWELGDDGQPHRQRSGQKTNSGASDSGLREVLGRSFSPGETDDDAPTEERIRRPAPRMRDGKPEDRQRTTRRLGPPSRSKENETFGSGGGYGQERPNPEPQPEPEGRVTMTQQDGKNPYWLAVDAFGELTKEKPHETETKLHEAAVAALNELDEGSRRSVVWQVGKRVLDGEASTVAVVSVGYEVRMMGPAQDFVALQRALIEEIPDPEEREAEELIMSDLSVEGLEEAGLLKIESTQSGRDHRYILTMREGEDREGKKYTELRDGIRALRAAGFPKAAESLKVRLRSKKKGAVSRRAGGTRDAGGARGATASDVEADELGTPVADAPSEGASDTSDSGSEASPEVEPASVTDQVTPVEAPSEVEQETPPVSDGTEGGGESPEDANGEAELELAAVAASSDIGAAEATS